MTMQSTTIAIIAASSSKKFLTALKIAGRALRTAKLRQNSTHLAIFASGLADPTRASVDSALLLSNIISSKDKIVDGLNVEHLHLIVGVRCLFVLRFVSSGVLGELCRVDADTDEGVEATIECLRRLPAIDDVDHPFKLPSDWNEHVENVQTFDWLARLWKQTQKDPNSDHPSPLDVLSLCMYAKAASMAFRTTPLNDSSIQKVASSTRGALASGLLSIFPVDDEAPSFLTFLKGYLVGDERPWEVTARGRNAAAVARQVLKRIFDHADAMLEVLAKSRLAEFVNSPGTDECALLTLFEPSSFLVGRVPLSARATKQGFQLVFEKETRDEPDEVWAEKLNETLRVVANTLLSAQAGVEIDKRLSLRVRKLIGAFSVISSPELNHLEFVSDSTIDWRFPSKVHLISGDVKGTATHIVRERLIKPSKIEIKSTSLNVRDQDGAAVSCAICTFCSDASKALHTERFWPPVLDVKSILRWQGEVASIAGALGSGPILPLGAFAGRVGPLVELDGIMRRLVFWRRRGEARESILTFFPREYLDVLFADYATSSRRLRMSDIPDLPFFAVDSYISLSRNADVSGGNGLAYKLLPFNQLGLLESDVDIMLECYESAPDIKKHGFEIELPEAVGRSFVSICMRGSQNDLLIGLAVEWAKGVLYNEDGLRRHVPILSAANSELEKVVY